MQGIVGIVVVDTKSKILTGYLAKMHNWGLNRELFDEKQCCGSGFGICDSDSGVEEKFGFGSGMHNHIP
jgi:hypothetical protein